MAHRAEGMVMVTLGSSPIILLAGGLLLVAALIFLTNAGNERQHAAAKPTNDVPRPQPPSAAPPAGAGTTVRPVLLRRGSTAVAPIKTFGFGFDGDQMLLTGPPEIAAGDIAFAQIEVEPGAEPVRGLVRVMGDSARGDKQVHFEMLSHADRDRLARWGNPASAAVPTGAGL